MIKVLFSFFVIISITFASTKEKQPLETLPDTLVKKEQAISLNEEISDTLLKDSSNIPVVDSVLNVGEISKIDSTEVDSVNISEDESGLSRREKKKKSRIRKKEYSHRHQVGTALGMMVLITLILSLGGELNPR